VPKGTAFWYENANGLAEIAVNGGPAVAELGLSIGMDVEVT
jgi:S-adenosylmethionine hydrolase